MFDSAKPGCVGAVVGFRERAAEDGRRELHAEALTEQIQLSVVLRGELVAVVHEGLHLGSETVHGSAGYVAGSREAFRRIDPLAVVVHPVHAAAGPVERDGMDVHLPPEPVDHDEALRSSTGDELVPEPLEELDDAVGRGELRDQVEVVVDAGLEPEERVDAPSTVEPDSDTVALEHVDDLEKAARVHGLARTPAAVGALPHRSTLGAHQARTTLAGAMAETVSTNQFRNGMHVELDGGVWRIVEFQHVKPGKGGAFVRTKLKSLDSGAVVDRTFRAGEKFARVHTEVKNVQYMYDDGSEAHFMDEETYEQFGLPRSEVADALAYLTPSSSIPMLAVDGKPAGLQLPASVELAVAETEPAVRGDTVSNVTKPATLETGAVVQVPLFIDSGERIKVDPREGRYISRA